MIFSGENNFWLSQAANFDKINVGSRANETIRLIIAENVINVVLDLLEERVKRCLTFLKIYGKNEKNDCLFYSDFRFFFLSAGQRSEIS
jgi:hypothetical protein